MENSLFRKSSLERIASPERLNEYIKITHPGVWSVLFACLALMIAVGFWAIYGNIPDTVRAKGLFSPTRCHFGYSTGRRADQQYACQGGRFCANRADYCRDSPGKS